MTELTKTKKTKYNLYIAGPMTGKEQFNFPLFDKVRDIYETIGFNVFSPADHDRKLLGREKDWLPTDEHHEGEWKYWDVPNAPGLRKMLGDDLLWIAENADAIVMLPGWENSKGAKAEWALAHALGLEISYL